MLYAISVSNQIVGICAKPSQNIGYCTREWVKRAVYQKIGLSEMDISEFRYI
jgi:hypothetical protein